MRIWSFILFFLLFQITVCEAQFSDKVDFDSLVNLSLSLSEKSIYAAEFDEAEKHVQLAHFEKFATFQPRHQLALTIQVFRIRSFKNRLQNIKTDPKENLSKLLDLKSIAEKVTDKNIIADYYSILASAYFSNKENETAFQYFDKALQLYTETENFYKVAQARASIISMKQAVLQRDNNLTELKDLIWKYDHEIEFAQEHKNKYAQSFNTRHLAQIYLRYIKDYEKAISLFEKSLSLRQEIGFKPYLPASYFSLGEVFEKREKTDNAIKMYEKSITTADEIRFVRYQYISRLKIAEIYQKKKDLNKANEFYVDALKSASSNGYLTGIEEALQKIEALNDDK